MNYDEYLMHLNRQFDENKVKRDKGGRFAKKAESSAASAVKNAKKRAQKETIRNKINSVIGMRKPINIVGDGAASAVKNAKRRSELRSVANKKTKTPLQQPWKQQNNKNTKQKIASAYASAKTGTEHTVKKLNKIKSKFGSYIDKLKGGPTQNLMNKGAASAVKREKTKVGIKQALKNAKGKFKECAARGAAYLGRVRGAAYGAKPYVDKQIDNAKTVGKKAASKAYNTARQVGMNARDEASKVGKKVKSAAIDSMLKSETGRKVLDAEYEVEKKVDHAKRMATAKRDYRSIAKKLAESASIAKVNSSEAREELLVDLTNKALNEYRSKPGSYHDSFFSNNDFEELVEETRKTLEKDIDKRLSDRKKKTN